ncbi:MAG: glycosyltransferase family 4 protein [Anaerolineales bacterium]|nr:glycosyltransferase family 4 protein [Anaerolineales bacterium]
MPSKTRVLICRSNPIDPDPRVEKIAASLAEAGYEVEVVGWDRTAELPAESGGEGFRLHRLPIRAPYGKGLNNLPQLMRWQFGLTRWLLRRRKQFGVLHACDFDTVLPALLAARLSGAALVYDIFDFYADHLRATPDWIKRLIRRVDLWAIGRAEGVILADDARTDQIKGSHPRRLAVIYNSPQEDDAPPSQAGNSPAQNGLAIGYVGLLQVERGLVELLDVIGRHPEWRLEMAGYGGDEEVILPLAEKNSNVRWHGRIDYNSAISLYRRADALVATYDPAIPNHRYSSPNKVFEAMMLGKPIIVAENTNMDRLIEENSCGLVIPYGDSEALEQALVQLYSDPNLRKTLGENGRQAYETRYSWARMAESLLVLYQEIAPAAG